MVCFVLYIFRLLYVCGYEVGVLEERFWYSYISYINLLIIRIYDKRGIIFGVVGGFGGKKI